MAQLNWDRQPELILKKGNSSPFTGILIPDQNYRNYKTLEVSNTELMEKLEESRVPLVCPSCEDSNCVFNSIIFGLLGLAVGGIIFHAH